MIANLEKKMHEAAADLEFETAARLRDEIKRLRETELAIADDPLARQADVEERAGAFAGDRKYGGAPRAGKRRADSPPPGGEGLGVGGPSDDESGSRIQRDYQPVQPTFAQTTTVPSPRARKPSLDDMGPGTDRAVPARDEDAVSRIRKPTLDEMGSHSNRPIPARDPSPSPRSSRGEGWGLPSAKAEGEGQPQTPRTPQVDPRTKAGAYGEEISGPHKPTLDEMGPHAERGLPVAGKPKPVPRTPPDSPPPGGEGPGVGGTRDGTKKKHRHGRPRKTGRPGA